MNSACSALCDVVHQCWTVRLSGEAAHEMKRVRQDQKSNVELSQTWSPDSVSDLTSFHNLPILCKRNIDYREELFVEYGISYDFTGR